MSALELMLLITSYIFVPFTPNIDQDGFNDLVNVAKIHSVFIFISSAYHVCYFLFLI